ncbi:2-oxo acid dehydrogenase subunit E2 [Stappia sp. ES.058]|uniref:2-oxo acid dehydrogenase subunit E2 n=1 Tax=Stappia sp. ES.058 TaxID=1881061 RepID=UPI00087C7AB6|nr:2-oxo acid dehydrogenase subunit E2 [Stappia sp. ES.058]SDU17945.1 pyruvate dehydrogenase E2 component (dihydrolipoamide acetyltransferase) [Stappia sp. ES.058]
MSINASPSTRAYARQQGVDLDALASNTGRQTLAREDVDWHLSGEHAAPTSDHSRYWNVDHSAYGAVSEEPLGRMAQVAAKNLAAANAMIPQVTHHDRADMRAVEAFRAGLKAEAAERGTRLTALAFHVKALAQCLHEFPRFNASLSADGETLHLKHFVHIGIAVDTPNGLMVPVVRDADRKGLWQIAAEISDLAARAQARKIRAEEMGGASMSISSLGGIGGTAFTPIVNPPEVAILGLTRMETVPAWENGDWTPVPMVPLDLSYDHRVLNGADAARFLTRYAALIGDPRKLVLANVAARAT